MGMVGVAVTGQFNYLLDRGWKGKIEILVGKKVPATRIEPLTFTCEASALTTEPP